MNLYLLTQSERNGYGTFDSCIVAAPNEDAARNIHPRGEWIDDDPYTGWASKPENVIVKFVGVAAPEVKEGVVLSSFNAG